MKELVERVAEAAVERTLLKMGINVSDSNSVLEVQADMRHLREWRVGVNSTKAKAGFAVLMFVVSGLMAAIWQAVVNTFHGGHHGG